jgi:hypothetical protein
MMAASPVLTARAASTTAHRTAFGVWSAAFALGALLHEWQTGAPPWTVYGLTAALAIGVLLRPTSTFRLTALMAAFVVELAVDLPNPWNHTAVAGMIGAGLVVWWLVQSVRSPGSARDPGLILAQISPFLRVAFIATWYLAAFAKLNTGFTDTVLTCSMWVVDAVPGATIAPSLPGVMIALTIAIELAIPTLLVFRRTRPLAVVAGFGFHLLSALAGHTAFSGLAWSFYLLFLPVGVLSGAGALARRPFTPARFRRIAKAARSPLTWVAVVACWAVALGALHLLDDMTMMRVKRWGPALVYVLWMGVWAWLLVTLRRRWANPRADTGTLRVRHPVFLAVLGLVLTSAASPYVGLKTKYSFTMYSNLHTEPGRWNHLVVPESARVFGALDGSVHFLSSSDPELGDALTVGTGAVATEGAERLVLMDARRLATAYPDAAATYEIDGVVRTVARLGDDPVLAPVPWYVSWLGGYRRLPPTDSCQH